MNSVSILTTFISSIIAILSIILTIITFSRNGTKDKVKEQRQQANHDLDIQVRLIKIETDINYIRQSIDDNKSWQKDVEHRISTLENNVHTTL